MVVSSLRVNLVTLSWLDSEVSILFSVTNLSHQAFILSSPFGKTVAKFIGSLLVLIFGLQSIWGNWSLSLYTCYTYCAGYTFWSSSFFPGHAFAIFSFEFCSTSRPLNIQMHLACLVFVLILCSGFIQSHDFIYLL